MSKITKVKDEHRKIYCFDKIILQLIFTYIHDLNSRNDSKMNSSDKQHKRSFLYNTRILIRLQIYRLVQIFNKIITKIKIARK